MLPRLFALAAPGRQRRRVLVAGGSVAPYALDKDAAECLWRETLRLLAVS